MAGFIPSAADQRLTINLGIDRVAKKMHFVIKLTKKSLAAAALSAPLLEQSYGLLAVQVSAALLVFERLRQD